MPKPASRAAKKSYWHLAIELRGLRRYEAPTQWHAVWTVMATGASHSRETARALRGEYGLDAGAFSVASSLQSMCSWAGIPPNQFSCVQQSPTNARPGLRPAHPMSSTTAPFQSYQLRPWAIDLRIFCQPIASVGHQPEKILT